jgi:hypothetical protein
MCLAAFWVHVGAFGGEGRPRSCCCLYHVLCQSPRLTGLVEAGVGNLKCVRKRGHLMIHTASAKSADVNLVALWQEAGCSRQARGETILCCRTKRWPHSQDANRSRLQPHPAVWNVCYKLLYCNVCLAVHGTLDEHVVKFEYGLTAGTVDKCYVPY